MGPRFRRDDRTGCADRTRSADRRRDLAHALDGDAPPMHGVLSDIPKRATLAAQTGGMRMRSIALVMAVMAALIAPAAAQKAEIEAVNAKWIELFNKGDFAGVASLYTEDATAFPPGAAMVKGRAAIAAMWKGMAEQVTDPKVTTLDVKALGTTAAREIGTF